MPITYVKFFCIAFIVLLLAISFTDVKKKYRVKVVLLTTGH